ncbi:hypothetical protein GCM10009819_20010 [Agromyces tropicus]|uniref:DUF998 domain-containing protein n=1 Tax=Agromyces tropicus TaxID=555371 RepID=A0ABP5G1B3_9MICO
MSRSGAGSADSPTLAGSERRGRGAGRTTITATTETPTPERIRSALRRTPAWLYAAIGGAATVAMAVVVTQPWVVPTDLVRDGQVVAAARGAASPAFGLVSNLGIVVTVLAAGAAITALALLPRGADARRLLAWCLGLSLVVALDDLLLLHETAAFGPGSGTVLAALYAAAFLAFTIRFRDIVVDRLDPALLVLMFAGLGTSAIVDVLVEPATRASVLVEDGAKLLGLLAWSAFVARAAILTLRAERLRERNRDRDRDRR